MRVPLSWLAEYVELPAVSVRELADRLVAAGLEVEAVERVGHELEAIVVGEVLEIEELTGFKKPIRHCRVDVGGDAPRGIICGATNFAAGARVPVVLPGGMLAGGFKITARKTYGHVSEGMICSEAELGLADSSPGIIVLPPDAPVGADFSAYAGLRDEVLDIAVTPDRGYALSIRGVARETALAYGVPFRDPADVPPPAGDPVPASSGAGATAGSKADATAGSKADSPGAEAPGAGAGPASGSYPASIADPTACDRFVLREVRGLRSDAQTPPWMRVRLARSGMRPVSLAVDVTNYLMHELGNPLHAFDRDKLSGPIVVRRARAGERLETLDHVMRDLHPEDVLIADDSGPISMAGTMGGLRTEIDERSSDMVLEAAHFSASATASMSRRHNLHSEASYRFERGVDRELPRRATAKAARMLAELGGAKIVPGVTQADAPVEPVTITMRVDHPARVAGVDYPPGTVLERLRQVGCEVAGPGAVTAADTGPGVRAATGGQPDAGVAAGKEAGAGAATGGDAGAGAATGGDAGAGAATGGASTGETAGSAVLTVTPPSWRPDLTDPNDLAEEVIRLEGYENIPSRPPRSAGGAGLTPAQRLRRRVGRALAAAGYVEVLSLPFTAERDADALQLPADDPRRRALRVANPLSADEVLLRTTLLPGLLRCLARNVGRGFPDAALYELGIVFLPRPGAAHPVPRLAVDRGPTEEELATLEAALPDQPLRVAAALCGQREPTGWQGPGRAADWADAVEAARTVFAEAGVAADVRADAQPPWHPGRCAALLAGDTLVGHAGELHPRVVAAYDLPPRTCAMELELTRLEAAVDGVVAPPRISAYPVATRDVALIVAEGVSASRVEAALRAGAGELLESVRLFDVYAGEQLGAGSRSLAFTLRLRAPDRTLSAEEATAARDAAVEEAARRTGAVPRG